MTKLLIQTEPYYCVVTSNDTAINARYRNRGSLKSDIIIDLSTDDEKLAFLAELLKQAATQQRNDQIYFCHWFDWLKVEDKKQILERLMQYCDNKSYSFIELGMRQRICEAKQDPMLKPVPAPFINAARHYLIKQIIDERALHKASQLAQN